ncbi:MAG: hypothetical protein Q4F29_07315 [Lachnospiraceae bacterium]|nr:hypothetical protein [Lachnospiraceae bacterium]
MNIEAVYELRERLEYAAVAGVNLIGEDFRLERAAGQLKPLAGVSPVFQKIDSMTEKLLAADCPDRAGLLLDILSLLDAVLCTQGGLQKEGKLQELSLSGPAGGGYQNIPYSRMAPVLEAFDSTGSGRYAVLRQAHQEDAKLFEDYRIVRRMVKALGDSYGELADMMAFWLKQKGMTVVPLLKQGFQADGKKEMARRLQVIEAVAGSGENEFYRAALNGSREVKEAAIRALRHENENLPLLLDLLKSEKGKLKDTVKRALACMDEPEAEGFWKEAMKKNELEGASYLADSRTDWASDLIAESLENWFKEYEEKPKDRSLTQISQSAEERAAQNERLNQLWRGAVGKHSGRLCACYEKVNKRLPRETRIVLYDSLMMNPHPSLCQVAEALYEQQGAEALGPVFLASLLTRSKEETFERFGEFLKPAGTFKKLFGKTENPAGLFEIFKKLQYSEEKKCYQISCFAVSDTDVYNPVTHTIEGTRLEAGLDLRWYPLLLQYEGQTDKIWKLNWSEYGNGYMEMMAGLYRPDVPKLQEPYGEFFYRNARSGGAKTADIQMLKRCGWTRYEGILEGTLADIKRAGK